MECGDGMRQKHGDKGPDPSAFQRAVWSVGRRDCGAAGNDSGKAERGALRGRAQESCDRLAGEEVAQKRTCSLLSQNECDIGTGRDLTRHGQVRSER